MKKYLIAIALLTATPAHADTIYYYTGSPYTTVSTDRYCPVSFCNGPGSITNPNAAADAAVFGTNLTGTMTFNFDTTGVTGSVETGSLPDPIMQFTSGNIFWTYITPIALSLTNGAITDWYLNAPSSSGGCSFSVITVTCGMVSQGYNGLGSVDSVQNMCTSCLFHASGGAGTWSLVAPVPGPIVGAGLPGILGLLGLWWGRKMLDGEDVS